MCFRPFTQIEPNLQLRVGGKVIPEIQIENVTPLCFDKIFSGHELQVGRWREFLLRRLPVWHHIEFLGSILVGTTCKPGLARSLVGGVVGFSGRNNTR